MGNVSTPVVLTVQFVSKRGALQVIVSGAPEHEMPLVRSGPFEQRYALLDDVYGALLLRKPQVVKASLKAAGGGKTAPAKSKPATGDSAEMAEDTAPVEAPAAGADALCPKLDTTDLPVIEGEVPEPDDDESECMEPAMETPEGA